MKLCQKIVSLFDKVVMGGLDKFVSKYIENDGYPYKASHGISAKWVKTDTDSYKINIDR